MYRFVLRRFLFMIVTLFVVSIIVFAATEVVPGDVARMMLGQYATPEALAALRERLGLNQPAYTRYLNWIGGVMRGDLGESISMGFPIAPLLLQRVRNSAILALLAVAMGVPLALVLGVIAGMNEDKWLDRIISVITLLAVALPEFVAGISVIVVFSYWLGILPASSVVAPGSNPLNSLRKLVLPSLTLTLAMTAHITRMTRSSMIEVLATDYFRTAVLKGLHPRVVIFKHALRNALIPTVTVIALTVGWLMGGLIVVESVFAYPGIGQLLLFAINKRDVPVLQAVALLIAATYTVCNLMADLLYAYLNPRISYA